MKFGLAIKSNLSKEKTLIITQLSDALEFFFKPKNYGPDVGIFTIEVICVTPQFSKFFKQKKIRYSKGRKVDSPDDIKVTIENSLELSIVIDYALFNNLSTENAKIILEKEILNSVENLDCNPAIDGIDFNFQQFKNDLNDFIKRSD